MTVRKKNMIMMAGDDDGHDDVALVSRFSNPDQISRHCFRCPCAELGALSCGVLLSRGSLEAVGGSGPREADDRAR